MPTLRALPSRVILEFPKPAEKSAGGIILSERSQLRPEIAKIHDVGDGVTPEERQIASRLRELQAQGKEIPVTYISGVSFWRDEFTQAGMDKGEYGWLRDLKAYRLTELAAFVEPA